MATEIIEEGINNIEIAASDTFNRTYHPVDGVVKFFRDEIGQPWVKFTTRQNIDSDVITRVIPTRRVVEVVYLRDG